eukprot:TRINITY_DN985_c0_g1_i1.p1 TRINITY_DN985_c0_g1~~TRINITY_DN985_c0_g1_i1.p1  ORF type:complete len:217 (+),score=62.03 TRINITY_DN985_c0_g1_i1:232-882(+)
MDDLQDYSDRLAQKIEELQDGLNEVGDLSGEKKREELRSLTNNYKRAETIYQSLDIELRDFTKAEAEEYFDKKKEYREQLDFIKEGIEAAKRFADTDKEGNKRTADDMLKEANELQGQDKEAIKRMKKTIAETETAGKDTLITLQQDGERLRAADSKMNELDEAISGARKELRKFIMGLGTDKVLRVLMIVVIAGILVVIIWRLVAGAPAAAGDKL